MNRHRKEPCKAHRSWSTREIQAFHVQSALHHLAVHEGHIVNTYLQGWSNRWAQCCPAVHHQCWTQKGWLLMHRKLMSAACKIFHMLSEHRRKRKRLSKEIPPFAMLRRMDLNQQHREKKGSRPSKPGICNASCHGCMSKSNDCSNNDLDRYIEAFAQDT